jgi:hypothetical protein
MQVSLLCTANDSAAYKPPVAVEYKGISNAALRQRAF